MPSNLYIQQYVSATAPIGAVLGDEWLNPANNKLYKQTLINGVVGWLDITPGATSGASGGGATITNTLTTNSNYYLGMSSTNSGAWTTAYTSDTKLYFNPSTGTLNSTNLNSLSDATKKNNIIKIENALDIISKIDGIEFDYIDSNQHSSGVTAQQLETVLPFLVTTDESGIKSVNYSGLFGYLIEAVKELKSAVGK
jgi:hypothetical protein